MDVDGFYGVTAGEVDAVKKLRKLDEFLVGLEVTGAFSTLQVPCVRRRGDVTEKDVLATDGECGSIKDFLFDGFLYLLIK